jgi:hypothetical protein
LFNREHSHPFGVWPELADLGGRISLTIENSVQVRTALGQGGVHEGCWRILAGIAALGQHSAAEHCGRSRDDAPQPFACSWVIVDHRSCRGEPGTNQADDTRCRIKAGIEKRHYRGARLMSKHCRTALAEADGRAGHDQLVSQVDDSPKMVHSARQRGQVAVSGQELGESVLLGIGACWDAWGLARI